ncbi:MAG: threonylcarbamoyl-AMP synthase [Crenarchaeota archaeon 13_1_40CM_2_52_14]|nr:MAG: threonylcarbamoyl-AMP synthase [Crenarchaeota archaeon 13_1_40CM_2_52_14]
MLTQFLNINGESIQKAAAAIQKGGIVVYPTDTVYGLGCNPFDEKAVNRVSAVKGRSKGNLPILVDTLGRARELGVISGDVETLALRYWPGPLTIVVPSQAKLPFQVTGLEKMVGLRIPSREDTLDLISKAGGTLLGTSANTSGNLSLRNAEDAFKVFEGKVDIVLNGGITPPGLESTVVRLTESGIQVLREGAIRSRDLRNALPPRIKLQE